MAKEIEVTFPKGKRVNAKIGDTLIETDQAVKSGGDGSAPEPFQLFLASIATCVGIYALGFCQVRGIETDGMSIKMSGEFDINSRQYVEFTFNLILPKNFPATHHEAIMRAMDSCPVKRHMVNTPSFNYKLTEQK